MAMTTTKALGIVAVSPLAILGAAAAVVQGFITLRTDFEANARADMWMQSDSRKFAREILDSRLGH